MISITHDRPDLKQYSAPWGQSVFKFLTKLRADMTRNSINSERFYA